MARQRHKKKALPIRLGEMPTKERRRQMGGIIEEVLERNARGDVYMVRYSARIECMLDSYLLRESINKREHRAGMRYRLAWLRARKGLIVRDRFTTGKAFFYEASKCVNEESEKILQEADEILSPAQKLVVLRVCADNRKAGGTDKLETLRRGLDALADGERTKGATKLSLPKRQ